MGSGYSWKWLPIGGSTWIEGGMIPIFEEGCGVAISEKELILIGCRNMS